MSLIDDLCTFFDRSWQERGLFVEAFVLLGIMRVAILLLPFRKVTHLLGLAPGDRLQRAETATIPTVIGWAIQAAASRTPWESACLVQALTGMVMLSRRGLNAVLYLGVAKDPTGAASLDAHAWLCCGGTVLTGGGGVERFSIISGFSRVR